MNGRRLRAMIRKEAWQAMRDPSTLLVTFLLPPLLLFLFAYGVSLDVKDVRIGLVLESDGPHARELAAAYQATPWLEVKPARHRKQLERDLVTGKLAAYVVIPQDFDAAIESPLRAAQVQIITDGSQPNSANFTASYALGVFGNWLAQQGDGAAGPRIQLQQRFWFNPELESRQVLAPGAIAMVMTMIGTILTAMVIAREWERGTMEALLATPGQHYRGVAQQIAALFCPGHVGDSCLRLLRGGHFFRPTARLPGHVVIDRRHFSDSGAGTGPVHIDAVSQPVRCRGGCSPHQFPARGNVVGFCF